MQGGPYRPCRARDVAPELRAGNKLLYSKCRAARTCRVRFWLSGCQGGEGCLGLSLPPEPRRGWEEAHAAGLASGQDGGADEGAVLLPAPLRSQRQLCLSSGRGFATGLEGAVNHTETWCVALPSVSLPLSPFLKVPQRLCCIP